MPMSQAVRACPDLIVVPPDMTKYKRESAALQRIFRAFTPLVEPLSLDEAYLDVSDCKLARGSATLIATQIRQQVKTEVGITISAGIAPNKFLAKIASDWNKPDGQFTVTPNQIDKFIAVLPVEKIFGVGSVTAKRMRDMGITTCKDLQKHPIVELTHHFGKFGARLYELCRGIDDRQVNTQRLRKSLSAERTYATDLTSKNACQNALVELVQELDERITRANCRPRIEQCSIKVRFAGFETTTVAKSGNRCDLDQYVGLFDTAWNRYTKPVRLLGVGVKLTAPTDTAQLLLFDS